MVKDQTLMGQRKPQNRFALPMTMTDNPVKHGLVRCLHEWEFSSFRWFVGEELNVVE